MRNVLIATLCGSLAAFNAGAVQRVERGNLVMEDIPPVPAELAGKLERYLNGRQASVFDWTPEGGLLIGTRFADAEQVHVVEQPMGSRRQLTFYNEPISGALYSPHNAAKGFIFLKDTGGNENAQIYFYGMQSGNETGEIRMLTDGRSLNGSAVWSNDGKQLAFFSNARNGTSHDIYVADPTSPAQPRLAMAVESGAWYPLDWSPDNRQLLVKNFVSINESYLYVVDAATGSKQRILPTDDRERIGIGDARFAKDKHGVYVVCDSGSEFKQLSFLRLPDSAQPPGKNNKPDLQPLSAQIPWDVESFDLSEDGRYLAYVTNEGGLSRLNLLEARNSFKLPAVQLPNGRIGGVKFDKESKRLAISIESARAPRDAWVYDIAGSKLTQWTRSETGPVDTTKFVDIETIQFPTFDRASGGARQIPAFVYKPRGAGPHPVFISIHGGPEAQYRPTFDAFTQFLVAELGVAVIAPNVRGSDGYGKTYLQLDNGFKREDSVKDIGALIAWIGMQPEFDRKRIVVSGGSYGGYMSLATLVLFGDRLLGGIDVVGIGNFLTFLQNTSGYRRDLRRAEYGDERNPDMQSFLRRISPFYSANRINKPLLVVQGQNDPRVPASEAEQMVSAIRGRGGSVGYLLAKDEGHGFRKKQNRDVYYQTVATFLNSLLTKQ